MAYSKIILNGETLMDVTSDTVAAGSLLYGKTATKNDGTKVTGNIANKTASDLTASGATVTAAAGYYPSAVSKAVTTTTHPNPTAAIASSTGVVTATHTQTTGYVTSGTTTGTLDLTTKAAATINTSTADQTIASYRWLTGTQTIKSVTTTNLTAANIASGVVVKVGDANNASRITQVTGTYAPAVSSVTVTPTETTQTFNATGVYGYKPVTVNGISSTYVGTGIARKSSADVAFASATATFTAPIGYYSASATKTLTTQAAQTIYPSTADQTVASYRWLTGNQTFKSVTTTNLTATNIVSGTVVKVGDSANASRITQVTGTYSGIIPTGTLTINSAGTHNVYNYASASVKAGAATTPATTVSPAFSATADANGIIHVTANGSSSITPTITSGYVTGGTAGTVTVSGAAAVPATTLDSNLVAENIASGATIFGVVGTHSGKASYTVTISGSGDGSYCYITYNGVRYYTNGRTFTYEPGELLTIYCRGNDVSINGEKKDLSNYTYTYELSEYMGDIIITLAYSNMFVNNVTINTTSVNAEDYKVTAAIAFNEQLLNNDIQGFSSFIGSLNKVGSYMFEGRQFSPGTYNFTNVSQIYDGAFNFGRLGYSIISEPIIFNFPNCTTVFGSAFVNRRFLTEVNFPNCTLVSHNAFNSCVSLTTISFPICTQILSSAFESCKALLIASFPMCSQVQTRAFADCTSLTTANFPVCNSIYYGGFVLCTSLVNINFPSCTVINSDAFRGCRALTSASFPNCSYISTDAFKSCSSLATISFPICTSIGTSAFYGCTALTTANFPSCVSMGSNAFYGCTVLTTASLPIVKSIGNYTFSKCYNLISLYLNSVSAIPTLGTSAFYSTPISTYSTSAGRYGSIFVPSSLYTAFTTATGWTVYSARMVSV